jgi:hypothetical protein
LKVRPDKRRRKKKDERKSNDKRKASTLKEMKNLRHTTDSDPNQKFSKPQNGLGRWQIEKRSVGPEGSAEGLIGILRTKEQ